MNLRSLFYVFTLAIIFVGTSADDSGADDGEGTLDTVLGGIGDFTKDVTSTLTGALSSVECSAETRAEAGCNNSPFTGTFVCREFASLFGNTIQHTVCARNVVEGLTFGLKSDTCGCCENEEGNGNSCPGACTCACGEGKVSVDFQILGFIKFNQCMTNNQAAHAVNWGNAARCAEVCEDGGR